MFGFIRLILCLVIFIVLSFIIRKTKYANKKSVYATIGILCFWGMIALFFAPFENTFISFSSPKEAYKYFYMGTEIDVIVEGENSAFIEGKSNVSIIPKGEGGWKVGLAYDIKTIKSGVVNEMFYTLYQHSESEDYYLTVCDMDGHQIDITDSNDAEFISVEYNKTGTNTIVYYAYVPNWNEDYRINIDGEYFALQ